MRESQVTIENTVYSRNLDVLIYKNFMFSFLCV